MNKQKFLELVGAAEKATGEDIKALEKLVQQYPFFQNGHAVLAKASRIKKLPSAPKVLNTAAVYATNRNVFKDYISSIAQTAPQQTTSQPTTSTKPAITPIPPAQKGDWDKFIEEVYSNLENWKSSRDQYLKYDEKHPEDIVILPVEKEEEATPAPDFSELKQQIANEVSLEEAALEDTAEAAKEEPASSKAEEIPAPTEPESVVDEAPEEKEVSAFDMVLDNIEAQIDSKVEENRKKREEAENKQAEEKTEKESKTEEPIAEKEIPKPKETPAEKESEPALNQPKEEIAQETPEPKAAPTPVSTKEGDGPEIEELDDQMEALEEEIMSTTPGVIPESEDSVEDKEVETQIEEVEEPEVAEEEAPLPPNDDESDTPMVDDNVEEVSPDTVYNFSTPPPMPMEAPADLSKKKPSEKKSEPVEESSESEEMMSSEELSDIVDKVSEKVEADTTPGDPDKLSDETSEQIEEELQNIAPPKKEVKKEKGNLEDPSEEEIALSESIEFQVDSSGDDDLDQFNEERKNLKLVPGASKGDKKFRLAILKRPHNFTKPKKEEDEKPKAKSSTKKPASKKTTEQIESSEPPKAKSTSTKKAVAKKTPATKKTSSKKTTDKKENKEDPESSKASPQKKASTSKKLTAKKTTTKKKDASDDEDIKKKTAELKRKKPDKDLQNSIIDSFISAEPSIEVNKGKKSLPDNTEDLSERSTAFPIEVVTENLATILMEQGKIERAIEIYEKLILKNPQKKTYFASQIEKLNKL